MYLHASTIQEPSSTVDGEAVEPRVGRCPLASADGPLAPTDLLHYLQVHPLLLHTIKGGMELGEDHSLHPNSFSSIPSLEEVALEVVVG
jgi:hypothetical protein